MKMETLRMAAVPCHDSPPVGSSHWNQVQRPKQKKEIIAFLFAETRLWHHVGSTSVFPISDPIGNNGTDERVDWGILQTGKFQFRPLSSGSGVVNPFLLMAYSIRKNIGGGRLTYAMKSTKSQQHKILISGYLHNLMRRLLLHLVHNALNPGRSRSRCATYVTAYDWAIAQQLKNTVLVRCDRIEAGISAAKAQCQAWLRTAFPAILHAPRVRQKMRLCLQLFTGP